MKTFLFLMVECGGNVPAQMSIARRLAARGHDVHVLADRVLEPEAARAGCRFHTFVRAPQHNMSDKQADLIRVRDQHVFILLIRVRQSLNQIADVGSDAEIPQVPDVDDDFDHARAGRPRGLFCHRGPFQFPTVQREPVGKLLNFAPHMCNGFF